MLAREGHGLDILAPEAMQEIEVQRVRVWERVLVHDFSVERELLDVLDRHLLRTARRTEETDLADAARRRFRELAEPELPRLYRFARRLVGDEAEDAVQDCLLNVYRKLGQLECDAAAPAWFTRILVNCCRDRHRRRGQLPLYERD